VGRRRTVFCPREEIRIAFGFRVQQGRRDP
jgi:hypothetical protein